MRVMTDGAMATGSTSSLPQTRLDAAPCPSPQEVLADINQYDISDPAHPKLTGRLFTGGSIRAGSGVTVTEGEFKDAQPDVKPVKGVTLQGGPQMIQLR